jgi:hypothetical protein
MAYGIPRYLAFFSLYSISICHREAGGAGESFTLSAGFPPVQVVDGGSTLEEAQLVGAAVTQGKV